MKSTQTRTLEETTHIDRISDLGGNAVTEISNELRQLLADVFALYLKTRNFHWHISGPHFHDYHLLLDEQAEQVFAMTDVVAERARKIGGETLRSIGDIAKHQRLTRRDTVKRHSYHCVRHVKRIYVHPASSNRCCTTVTVVQSNGLCVAQITRCRNGVKDFRAYFYAIAVN
ncbi:MAG TPA: DNA starvation/stationary phase protection protein [Candidatus Acidoferrum sp.]|nr:DNA starvation/stationary phase protection protein [Candidatus Acidoferrum sp.]